MTSLRGFAVLFLALACSGGSASAGQPLPNGGRPLEKVAFPAIVDWSSLRIGLERTACAWRSCPV